MVLVAHELLNFQGITMAQIAYSFFQMEKFYPFLLVLDYPVIQVMLTIYMYNNLIKNFNNTKYYFNELCILNFEITFINNVRKRVNLPHIYLGKKN